MACVLPPNPFRKVCILPWNPFRALAHRLRKRRTNPGAFSTTKTTTSSSRPCSCPDCQSTLLSTTAPQTTQAKSASKAAKILGVEPHELHGIRNGDVTTCWSNNESKNENRGDVISSPPSSRANPLRSHSLSSSDNSFNLSPRQKPLPDENLPAIPIIFVTPAAAARAPGGNRAPVPRERDLLAPPVVGLSKQVRRGERERALREREERGERDVWRELMRWGVL